MQASERAEAPARAVPPAEPVKTSGVAGVSMRDLLASCVAASAVSTPPRVPAAEARRQPEAA
ncbi:hypothetical protein [Streptomyces poonensis]|uniref:Uncharacterized protein n=1 Tax=Streptomyces poonensis TaxID=68255 RepID=A0A918P9G9_9ACTN|nr:hypothetical protein [Streptomyces poonensis]GGY92896.1 hypothetical protein GCM10010365_09330 [Streptomyces poonensis]GLJ87627.1 hypothetical protein GCM10017589_02270 [Streptomyces poonensis]